MKTLWLALLISASALAAEDDSHHRMERPSAPSGDRADGPSTGSGRTETEDATGAVTGAGAGSGAERGKYPPPTAAEMSAAFPDLGGMTMQDHMGGQHYGKVLLDRLEVQDADAHTATVWDGRANWGSGFDKLWFSSEGEHVGGRTEHLKSQLFWGHACSRWWESTLGVRQDGGEGPDRTWAAFGVQGLAPYFFDVAATGYIGESGRTALTLEAEYELLLSNRLILQPRLEINAYGKNDPEKSTGSGISDSEFGLRLRYEIRREFAPFIGLEWTRKYGNTAEMAQNANAPTSDTRAVAGLRIWF